MSIYGHLLESNFSQDARKEYKELMLKEREKQREERIRQRKEKAEERKEHFEKEREKIEENHKKMRSIREDISNLKSRIESALNSSALDNTTRRRLSSLLNKTNELHKEVSSSTRYNDSYSRRYKDLLKEYNKIKSDFKKYNTTR